MTVKCSHGFLITITTGHITGFVTATILTPIRQDSVDGRISGVVSVMNIATKEVIELVKIEQSRNNRF